MYIIISLMKELFYFIYVNYLQWDFILFMYIIYNGISVLSTLGSLIYFIFKTL